MWCTSFYWTGFSRFTLNVRVANRRKKTIYAHDDDVDEDDDGGGVHIYDDNDTNLPFMFVMLNFVCSSVSNNAESYLLQNRDERTMNTKANASAQRHLHKNREKTFRQKFPYINSWFFCYGLRTTALCFHLVSTLYAQYIHIYYYYY